jgi:hypothetical protein
MKLKGLTEEDKEHLRDAFSEDNWKAIQKLCTILIDELGHQVAISNIEKNFDQLQRNKMSYDGARELASMLTRARTALRKP